MAPLIPRIFDVASGRRAFTRLFGGFINEKKHFETKIGFFFKFLLGKSLVLSFFFVFYSESKKRRLRFFLYHNEGIFFFFFC